MAKMFRREFILTSLTSPGTVASRNAEIACLLSSLKLSVLASRTNSIVCTGCLGTGFTVEVLDREEALRSCEREPSVSSLTASAGRLARFLEEVPAGVYHVAWFPRWVPVHHLSYKSGVL
ncbi:hypothetical protein HPB48_010359 [Haemaphysalis longicornis]|uniref:Uncharacterized protein n=1 Tax=Haemaphysalis longicornis TaxID=44386 RepID=A0A9J6GKJ1_HAELO|nr:hypothetical protein HPB48_010359 [Haemaphysalis longicornis]